MLKRCHNKPFLSLLSIADMGKLNFVSFELKRGLFGFFIKTENPLKQIFC